MTTESDPQALSQEPREAPLSNRLVDLRPPMVGDYDMLRMIEATGDLTWRWRAGHAARPEDWVDQFWAGVLTQQLIFPKRGDGPLGLVAAYNGSARDGTAYLSALRFDRGSPSALFLQGVALFLDYAFVLYDFHKLYMEVPAFNLPQIASGIGRYFEVEGRFRDHMTYGGRRWDLVTLALYQDTWNRVSRPALAAGRQAGPGPPAQPTSGPHHAARRDHRRIVLRYDPERSQ